VHEQRHAEHGLNARLPEGRVEDVDVVGIVDHDRAPLGRDAAGEFLRRLIAQEDAARVRVERLAYALDELVERLAERDVRERGDRDGVKPPQALDRRPIGIARRRPSPFQAWRSGGPPQGVGSSSGTGVAQR
jgi:hypothetical protein